MRLMTTSLADGFSKVKGEKKLCFTLTTRHFHRSLGLFRSYSLVRFLALSHSQAHRHIIVCFHKGKKKNVSCRQALCGYSFPLQ